MRLNRDVVKAGLLCAFGLLGAPTRAEAGDPVKGEQYFRACGACHSLAPNHNMTGPSLAGVIGRKAGTLASFQRYSEALKSSSVVWDEKTLDAWLTNPSGFISGSTMAFRGIDQAAIRADLIAYLNKATTSPLKERGSGAGAPGDEDLKKLGPESKVRSITYCPDTYRVMTEDGQTKLFWERNLRFKTDSSVIGPEKGAPALTFGGMQGDRGFVIFNAPEEIAPFIKRECPGQ
jgi:cytochrome c